VPLAWVDQQHLAGRDLSLAAPVVEVEVADRDDQGHWDRVAVLWNILSWLQPQTDHAHRSAVSDLLEAKGTP
jgi:hypothetical protein